MAWIRIRLDPDPNGSGTLITQSWIWNKSFRIQNTGFRKDHFSHTFTKTQQNRICRAVDPDPDGSAFILPHGSGSRKFFK